LINQDVLHSVYWLKNKHKVFNLGNTFKIYYTRKEAIVPADEEWAVSQHLSVSGCKHNTDSEEADFVR
jgi:hypothetical protein